MYHPALFMYIEPGHITRAFTSRRLLRELEFMSIYIYAGRVNECLHLISFRCPWALLAEDESLNVGAEGRACQAISLKS
jgi:hypothetical protein